MTVVNEHASAENGQSLSSLSTAAARKLTATTKSVPQMQEITSRWLLRVLPWVQVSGGAYRVNRRLTYSLGDGRVSFTNVGTQVRVVPPELCELAMFRGFDDVEALDALAQRFTQHEFAVGDTIVEFAQSADRLYLLAHGKVDKLGEGRFGTPAVLGVLADGQYFGDRTLLEPDLTWEFSVRAATACTVLALPRANFLQLLEMSESLRGHIEQLRHSPHPAQNKHGEAEIELASGHQGEPHLPGTASPTFTTSR